MLQKIVIVGGGAGGLELATKLGNNLGKKKLAKIFLVDRSYIHLWKPLLHKFAAGSLYKENHAISYIAHAKNHYFQFYIGEMIGINRIKKTIMLNEVISKIGHVVIPKRELNYDILVIAIGSESNHFTISGVKKYCSFIDNILQAKQLYNRIFNLFLKISTNFNINKEKYNITIVGGGATGVELSAELYNTIEGLHQYGFQGLKKDTLDITLIEMGPRILPALPEKISNKVYVSLKKIGIKVINNTTIVKCNESGLFTKNGEYIKSELIVWSAGIKTQKFKTECFDLETNHIHQLLVKDTLQTTLDEKIFAIGDCASCLLKNGIYVPPRAQAAHQMATCTYLNILSLIKDRSLKSYIYKDHGSLISLSKFKTIGNLIENITNNSILIEGVVARLAYLLVYRMHQISLHGTIKTGVIMLSTNINRIVQPKFKLY
ncbi:MAG: NAD(P)/FAD-dependent oxidoreductase [Wigglesworthia glossinidia]|nr:NAD(P)/FAD-dependent oxidoreductase [Wigglesworthia glossinidia]